MNRALLIAALLCSSPTMAAGYKCIYNDAPKNIALEEPCSIADKDGGWELTLQSGAKVQVQFGKTQKQSALMAINGKPAVGHVINQKHIHAATMDIEQSIEWFFVP